MLCNESFFASTRVLEALTELVASLTPELNFACINKFGRNLLGIPLQEGLVNKKLNLATFIQQEDQNLLQDVFVQLGQGKLEEWQGNLTLLSMQGNYLPCSVSLSAVFNGRKLSGFVFLATDLRHFSALEKQKKLANRIFENTIEGILITNNKARIQQVNTAFLEITGYSKAELLGQTPKVLRSEHHDDEFYAEMWRSIAETNAWQGEIWNRRKDGSVYLQWMSMNAIRNEQGEIEHYFSIVHDLSELRAKEAQIQHLAQHDFLTGLGNRHLLNQRLEQAIRQANSQANELALISLDLGHIKILNETYGHTWCDKLIQAQSKKLEELIGETDTLVRLGADELALLIQDADAINLISMLINDITEVLQEPASVDGISVTLSPSIGVAFYPADAATADELLSSSQLALKEAKELGRDNFSYFDPSQSNQAKEQLRLEQALRSALTGEGLSLHFQPKVNLVKQEVMGVEALIRWQHPELGNISPGVFIPLAEKTGIINSLGTWVVEEACRSLARWRKAGLKLPQVAVNLAVQQLENPDFAEWLSELVAGFNLDKDLFELEITETGLMENESLALETLNQLKAAGFRMALDDFGTGYSSLSYLRKLPISTLKIDQSFIQEMTDDDVSLSIVKTLVQLAHNLKLDLVAEGVEEKSQAMQLVAMGCKIAQGFLFYRPLPEEELIKLLAE